MDRQPTVDTTHQVQVTGGQHITDSLCINGDGAPGTPAPLLRFQHLTPTSNVYARTAPTDLPGTYHPGGAQRLGLFLA